MPVQLQVHIHEFMFKHINMSLSRASCCQLLRGFPKLEIARIVKCCPIPPHALPHTNTHTYIHTQTHTHTHTQLTYRLDSTLFKRGGVRGGHLELILSQGRQFILVYCSVSWSS